MDFEYTGRHVDVTPSLRAHVEEHFGKVEHLFPNSTTARAHVIIDVVKNRHIAEILLHWRDHTLTAKDTNADMYQALTRCIDKIEKQAVDRKSTRLNSSHANISYAVFCLKKKSILRNRGKQLDGELHLAQPLRASP